MEFNEVFKISFFQSPAQSPTCWHFSQCRRLPVSNMIYPLPSCGIFSRDEKMFSFEMHNSIDVIQNNQNHITKTIETH